MDESRFGEAGPPACASRRSGAGPSSRGLRRCRGSTGAVADRAAGRRLPSLQTPRSRVNFEARSASVGLELVPLDTTEKRRDRLVVLVLRA